MARPGPKQRRRAAEMAAAKPKQGIKALELDQAVVTSATNPATVSGGANYCTVSWRGSTFPAIRSALYSPAPGDVVLIAFEPPGSIRVLYPIAIAP